MAGISRRQFFAAIGVGTASVAVPLSLAEAIAKCVEDAFKKDAFDPAKEYGRLACQTTPESDNDNLIIKILNNSLSRVIPSRYMMRVQILKTLPMDFDRRGDVAWYYSPKNKPGYLGSDGKWVFNKIKGVYVWEKKNY